MQNKCVPYWPEMQGSKEVGPYVVTCVSERDATDYKVRVMEISPLDQVGTTCWLHSSSPLLPLLPLPSLSLLLTPLSSLILSYHHYHHCYRYHHCHLWHHCYLCRHCYHYHHCHHCYLGHHCSHRLAEFTVLLMSLLFVSFLSPPRLSQSDSVRTIWHYQYLSWPDHGVPEEPGGVLSFLSQVNLKQAEFTNAGPMIIHCRYILAVSPKLGIFQLYSGR